VDPFYNPYGWPIHEYAVFYAGLARGFESGTAFLVRTEPGHAKTVLPTIERRSSLSTRGEHSASSPSTTSRTDTSRTKWRFVTLMSTLVGLLVLVTSLGIVG